MSKGNWIKCIDKLPPNNEDFNCKVRFKAGVTSELNGEIVNQDFKYGNYISHWLEEGENK